MSVNERACVCARVFGSVYGKGTKEKERKVIKGMKEAGETRQEKKR